MKVVGIIPSHLNSVRFPKKILYKIKGLPMIEHVRRRALISKQFDEVVVCTCDLKIKKVINNYNGKVIMTSRKHKNGTSRVIEAMKNMNVIKDSMYGPKVYNNYTATFISLNDFRVKVKFYLFNCKIIQNSKYNSMQPVDGIDTKN